MKKINKKILAITFVSFVFFTGLFTACKDSFLEQTNTFQGGALGLSTTQDGVVSLVNGIYDIYQNSDLLKKCLWYRVVTCSGITTRYHPLIPRLLPYGTNLIWV